MVNTTSVRICLYVSGKLEDKRKRLLMDRRKKRYMIFSGNLVVLLYLLILIIRSQPIECYVIYNDENIIKMQENNNEQWLFLPSDTNFQEIEFYVNVHSIFSKYKKLKLTDATRKVKSDKVVTNAKITSIDINSIAKKNEKTGSWKLNIEDEFGRIYGIINIAKSRNVHTIILDSEESKKWVDSSLEHTNKTKATVHIYDQEGKNIYSDATSVRGHGNATWYGTDKKSYRLDLNKEFSFGTLEKKKAWILTANAFDPTLIHNLIAYKSAREYQMPYTSDAELVDFYWNGMYCGNYLMVQKIVWPGIEKVQDEDGNLFPFLLEEDSAYYKDEDNWFEDSNGVIYTPKNINNLTNEEEKNLVMYMNDVADVVKSKERDLSQYYNIQSMCKFYIMQEYFKNRDSFFSSTYWYTKNNKLYAGPVWDFDTSMGIPVDHNLTNAKGRWANSRGSAYFFTQNYYFQDELKECYKNFEAEVVDVLQGKKEGKFLKSIDEYKTIYADAAKMNYCLWNMQDRFKGSKIQNFKVFATWCDSIDYTKNYLNERNEWFKLEVKKAGHKIDFVTINWDGQNITLDGDIKSYWAGTDTHIDEETGKECASVIANEECYFAYDVSIEVNGKPAKILKKEKKRLEIEINE